jgi:predicted transcriptional regulator
LQWRRSKVVEMRAKGMSQIEIACELQVSDSSISSDIQYLRSQAKESIKEYVTEHLPEQYQVCLIALDSIIKRAFDIVETSEDNREKLQAMELFKDTHLVKLELLSNATTIDSALEYIRSKQQQSQQHDHEHQNQKKAEDLDSTDEDEGDDSSSRSIPSTATTTGKQSVF